MRTRCTLERNVGRGVSWGVGGSWPVPTAGNQMTITSAATKATRIAARYFNFLAKVCTWAIVAVS
jgi:hypothetical protein